MQAEFRLKLLKLTRDGKKADLTELGEQLRSDASTLAHEMGNLREKGLISTARGLVGLDTRQRIAIAEQLIQDGSDPQKVSRYLEWQEFEDFASHSLEQNGFRTKKHIVFKTSLGRREIDLLAWNDIFLLAVDCKHWSHGLSPSRVRKAAEAQVERSIALSHRSELLGREGVGRLERRAILPMIFALADPRERIVDGVPIVSVSKIVSFLFGISPCDSRFRIIPVKTPTSLSFLTWMNGNSHSGDPLKPKP